MADSLQLGLQDARALDSMLQRLCRTRSYFERAGPSATLKPNIDDEAERTTSSTRTAITNMPLV